MKLKRGFILHEIDDMYMVVPMGEDAKDFNGIIKCNSTAAFLWGKMQNEFTEFSLASDLLCEYDISDAVAKNTVREFIKKCLEVGVIDNE